MTHVHKKEPSVLVQAENGEQLWSPVMHSLISVSTPSNVITRQKANPHATSTGYIRDSTELACCKERAIVPSWDGSSTPKNSLNDTCGRIDFDTTILLTADSFALGQEQKDQRFARLEGVRTHLPISVRPKLVLHLTSTAKLWIQNNCSHER